MTTDDTFAKIARALHDECTRLGLDAPAFRTPPRTPGDRALRRCPNATVVSIRLGRDPHDVTTDMIDGVIAANQIDDPLLVGTIRTALWEAAGYALAA